MTWTWDRSLIDLISEARSLTKESLAARRQSHIDTWNSTLRPGSFLIETDFWLIVSGADVGLILIRSLISESLRIAIEPEMSSTSNSSGVSLSLEVGK